MKWDKFKAWIGMNIIVFTPLPLKSVTKSENLDAYFKSRVYWTT
jgi:hypothetical protein